MTDRGPGPARLKGRGVRRGRWSGVATGVIAATLIASSALNAAAMATAAAAPVAVQPTLGEDIDEPSRSASPPSTIPATTGVPMFFGAGTPTDPASTGTAIELTTPADLAAHIRDASSALTAAIQQFFSQSGGPAKAYVQTVADESAATLSTAISASSPSIDADLFAVPALGSMTADDHLQVAEALGNVAVKYGGLALLDPPTSVVRQATSKGGDMSPLVDLAARLRTAVADPGRVVLYASGLTDSNGDAVPASAAAAGLMNTSDADSGVWSVPAGPALVLGGLTPILSASNPQLAELGPGGVDAFRSIPGHGTVLWGSRTLAVDGGDTMVSDVRTLNFVDRSITGWVTAVTKSGAPVSTDDVRAAVSAFLTSLWQQGGLIGATAPDAFSVTVGPDGDAGYSIDLTLAVAAPGNRQSLRVVVTA